MHGLVTASRARTPVDLRFQGTFCFTDEYIRIPPLHPRLASSDQNKQSQAIIITVRESQDSRQEMGKVYKGQGSIKVVLNKWKHTQWGELFLGGGRKRHTFAAPPLQPSMA